MKTKALAKRPMAARSIIASSIRESPKHQPVSSRRSVSGVVAPAEQLNSPDTVCLAVTGAAGKKTGVPTTGPKGDTRPGPVCVWFAQKAGHDVAGYYEKVGAIGTRFMVGVQLNDGRRVNCVMELDIQEFKLIQLTEPFNAGSEIYGIVPLN